MYLDLDLDFSGSRDDIGHHSLQTTVFDSPGAISYEHSTVT